MAAKDFWTCPACDTRNKAKWELCVRCAEERPEATAAEAESSTDAEGAPDATAGSLWGFFLTAVVVAGVGLYAATHLRLNANEPKPVGLLNLGTLPAKPAAEKPFVKKAGQEAFEKGQRKLLQGDAAGALALLAEAVSEDPSSALFHDVYAAALWKVGSRDQALEEYALAVALAPENTAYRLDKAKGLAILGKLPEAIREYEALLAQHPGDDVALQDLARLIIKSGTPGDAVPLLRAAVRQRPQDLVLQQDLAYALEQSGGADEAANVYAGIVERFPEAHVSRGRLAEVLFKQGKTEQAIQVYEAGLDTNPNAALLHRGLGSLLERAGRVEEAIAEYRAYAKLVPEDEDAKQLAKRATGLERKLAALGSS